MTPDLKMAAWTLLLAFIQILLFDFARTGQYGAKWNMSARDAEVPDLKPLAVRLHKAQANLFETLPLFIGAVLIAHVAGKASAQTALGAQIYFWCRVAYVPLYAFGVPYVRSLVWVGSIFGLAKIAAAIL